MPEPTRQQSVEERVEVDEDIEICAGPNCGKAATRTFNNVPICSIFSDCYTRYLREKAKEEQKARYAEDMTPQLRLKLHQHNMGRGSPSLNHFERAYSQSS